MPAPGSLERGKGGAQPQPAPADLAPAQVAVAATLLPGGQQLLRKEAAPQQPYMQLRSRTRKRQLEEDAPVLNISINAHAGPVEPAEPALTECLRTKRRKQLQPRPAPHC
jgi:hypothetical protein